MPFEPSSSKLVAVEGLEEVAFFDALAQDLSIPGIQVKDYAGKNKLGHFLKALVRTPGFREVDSLGIVRDADDNAKSAFQSVESALSNAGLNVLTKSGDRARAKPRVSILILPDGRRRGMLEDVCLDWVRSQPAFPCIEELFHCVLEVGDPQPRNMSKAQAYAYLATREDPGRRVGEAAKCGTWPFQHSAFKVVRDFLKTL